MEEIRVYIASAYTNGDVPVNVRLQMDIADILIDKGFYPFIPLLYHFQHMYNPRRQDEWLKLDLVWVKQCDCLLRLHPVYKGGVLISPGADLEEEHAKKNGIPVFYSIDEVVNYYK